MSFWVHCWCLLGNCQTPDSLVGHCACFACSHSANIYTAALQTFGGLNSGSVLLCEVIFIPYMNFPALQGCVLNLFYSIVESINWQQWDAADLTSGSHQKLVLLYLVGFYVSFCPGMNLLGSTAVLGHGGRRSLQTWWERSLLEIPVRLSTG